MVHNEFSINGKLLFCTAANSAAINYLQSAQELVGQDTERPYIDGVVMLLALNHLWRQVVQGTAQSFAASGGRVYGPTKVGNLDFTLDGQEQVLGLNVTMDHVLFVEVLQSVSNGVNVLRHIAINTST